MRSSRGAHRECRPTWKDGGHVILLPPRPSSSMAVIDPMRARVAPARRPHDCLAATRGDASQALDFSSRMRDLGGQCWKSRLLLRTGARTVTATAAARQRARVATNAAAARVVLARFFENASAADDETTSPMSSCLGALPRRARGSSRFRFVCTWTRVAVGALRMCR